MKLKVRIINFLGSIGGQANIGIVSNAQTVNLRSAMAWDTEEHLSFALPFQDMKPTIYLGNIILRLYAELSYLVNLC